MKPTQIDSESLHLAAHAMDELRARGQDGDWLQALVDLLEDRRSRRGDALRAGLEQLRRGELEPA